MIGWIGGKEEIDAPLVLRLKRSALSVKACYSVISDQETATTSFRAGVAFSPRQLLPETSKIRKNAFLGHKINFLGGKN